MVNFKEYQIKELRKHFLDELDAMFVELCEKTLTKYNKLPRPLNEHLNDLFWKYHE